MNEPQQTPAHAAAPVVPTALFRIVAALAPPDLHKAAWEACLAPHWLFGNQSVAGRTPPFWKMELGGVAAVDALWQHARPQCEGLLQRPLRVLRQYANGHTYGQGGRPHQDDAREGTYTLLYYPMPEWRRDWEGETMFYDHTGDIVHAVLPLPNRAVFFDSRIGHAGRPPSRYFLGLRVTIAFKLEIDGAPSSAQ